MEKTKIMVEFNFFGEIIDFDKLTSLLKIMPTETRRKEECKVAEYAKDSWTFSTGYRDAMAISSVFEELVNVLNMKIEIINQIKEKLDLQSNIVIVIKSDANRSPEFIITNKCVKFAANTNSEIHFDNYFYIEDK